MNVDALKLYGGTYSSDCSNSAAPRLLVVADALVVEAGGKRMIGRNVMVAPSFLGPTPPPNYVIALLSSVGAEATSLGFIVYRDSAGQYIVLDGGPRVMGTLGNALATPHYRRCSGAVTTASAPLATAPGIIHRVAGSGTTTGFSGDGGPATSAKFYAPHGVAVDAAGNLYIADEGNERIRKVTPGGIITTVAGNGTAGFSGDGGPATSAELHLPSGVAVDAAGNLYVSDYYNYRIRVVSGSPTGPGTSAKALGDCGCNGSSGQPQVGVPITVGTGNMFEQATDYTTPRPNPLGFTRYYNSTQNVSNPNTFATILGTNWRSNYDRYLNIVSASSVSAERPEGQVVTFTLNGSNWTPDSDVDAKLTNAGSTWTLTDHNDNVETYSASGAKGTLQSIVARDGYTQTLNYSSTLLSSVTDRYGRSLNFTYTSGGLLRTLSTPDNLTFTYGFTPTSGRNVLTSVAYSTTPATNITYQYGNASLPFALTGIVDENGNQYSTWTYDTQGRATTSQRSSGADLTTLAYNSDGTTTVTNALGVADTYTFTKLQGVPKVTQISRAATSTTAVATRAFTYDSNGYLASATDWNGNITNYTNDRHGEPTTILEASGSSVARTTTINYDPTWVHLPHQIITPGLTSTFVYDGSGNVLTRTDTDTTTSTVPYSTSAQTRVTTFTWSSTGEETSVQLPRTNVTAKTSFAYGSDGALTQISDALGHLTKITAHTGGGLPLTIVDPNNVTTTLAYDGRLNLNTSTLQSTAGNLVTTWTHDASNELTAVQLPDGSQLHYGYDAAHRLIKLTDSLGNYTSYTLDALGDRAQTSIYTSASTLTWQDSGMFDALGRELVHTVGTGQTTTRTYDPNGNVRTVKDGLNHTTTNTYDALSRLSTSTDANGGMTTTAYDPHNRIVIVTDANSNTTAYARDGFGDVIQQTSPDSGVSVFHYDGDANLTSKTDALGIVMNQTFDALDRPLTTSYPADPAENVVYTYDQAGTGFAFGIGRLTSVTDAAGSLTRTYEERGNLAAEKRINGSTTLTTSYTYDGASRVASMTYPDGTFVTYQYNAAGYLATVSAKPAGSSTTTTIATLNHQPFGPINAATYGNGTAETWAFDNAYRPINITDALSGGKLQNLTYAYDNASNVTSITDALNATNSQTLGYDAVNRLISAASGTSGYGNFAWTYDKVGNRLTQVQGSATTTYGYTPGTNRLATITPGTTTALLRAPQMMKRRSGPGPVLSAQDLPSAKPAAGVPTTGTVQQSIPDRRPANTLANILGWPMLLVGFAGVLRFRTRLLSDRVLATIVLAMLTGGATILIGCAGGSNAGSTPPPPTATAPTFSPVAGTYTSAQAVTISDATAGAAIYYTTDGKTPTTNSTKYNGAITVSTSETINAIAVASGYTNSAVATATYTINLALPTAATPTFSPVAGTYTSAQAVTISDSTAGAAIYYTTNGTAPSASSTQYTGPATASSSETIEAIAVASGYANSAIATASYTINLPTVVTVTTNANGNITSIPPANSTAYATFAYNNANRLASVTGSPLGATFVYDWAGQRFSKTNNGSTPTIYSYAQGGTLIAENNGGAVIDYIYADGRPIAIMQPGATPAANQVSYVLADHLGTPQLVSNSSGVTVWSTVYQPFGTTGIIIGSISQYLRFPGQIADTETSFSYNLNRDYMPNLGRYLESDPIGLDGGLNTFEYAGSKPVKNIDPLGLDWVDSVGSYLSDQVEGLGDTWLFQPNTVNFLVSLEGHATFGLSTRAYRHFGLGDQFNECSTAFKVGEWVGSAFDVFNVGHAVYGLYEVVPKLAVLNVGKNGLYYGGRQGAWSFEQVNSWWKQVNRDLFELNIEIYKKSSEVNQGQQ